MNEQKTLVLTLSKTPFDLMQKGIKKREFRKPSEWIKSRLFNKDGSRKEYDTVKFTNGYRKDKPTFTAIFNGFDTIKENASISYDSSLTVEASKGDFVIFLGDVIKRENIYKRQPRKDMYGNFIEKASGFNFKPIKNLKDI